MSKPLAEALGDFRAGLQFRDLPAEAVRVAKTGIIDCMGVIVAGNAEPPAQILLEALTAAGRRDESCRALREVLRRWGGVSSSITARRARALSDEQHCDAGL